MSIWMYLSVKLIFIVLYLFWPAVMLGLLVFRFRRRQFFSVVFLALAEICLLTMLGLDLYYFIRDPHVNVTVNLGGGSNVPVVKSFRHLTRGNFTVFLSLPGKEPAPFAKEEAEGFNGEIAVSLREQGGAPVLIAKGGEKSLRLYAWTGRWMRYRFGDYRSRPGAYEIQVSILQPDESFAGRTAYVGIESPTGGPGLLLPFFLWAIVFTLCGTMFGMEPLTKREP